jgi:paired amphipathic helix protein Sin3a
VIGQALYSRLHLFKNIAMERVNDPTFDTKSNTTVMDLELMQASASACPQEGQGQVTALQYYEFMLETCERLFDNQVEQHAFEDQMREMFGLQARFPVFCPSLHGLSSDMGVYRTRTKYSLSIKLSPPSLNT